MRAQRCEILGSDAASSWTVEWKPILARNAKGIIDSSDVTCKYAQCTGLKFLDKTPRMGGMKVRNLGTWSPASRKRLRSLSRTTQVHTWDIVSSIVSSRADFSAMGEQLESICRTRRVGVGFVQGCPTISSVTRCYWSHGGGEHCRRGRPPASVRYRNDRSRAAY